MHAIDFEEFGSPDVLRMVTVPEPSVRPTDILVRVHATGVNRADISLRRGRYGRPDFGDSALMGLEIAGEVVAVGPDAVGFQVGDRVMGITGGGGYAECARLDYRMAMPVPAAVSYESAAAIPEAFVTAHEAAFHLGRLANDETVLIHAAASSVGTAAVQMALARGARVIASASSGKQEALKRMGVQVGIAYDKEDFADRVREETQGAGVDVVLDFVGADNLERNVDSLKIGGRLVQVGLLGGLHAGRLPMQKLVEGCIQIIGTVMKSRGQSEKYAMVSRFSASWIEAIASGSLSPIVARTLPLSDAAEAHRLIESNAVVGKVVLRVA